MKFKKAVHRDLVGFQRRLLGEKILTQNAPYKERILKDTASHMRQEAQKLTAN
jgi:hypothetical protein